MPAPAQQPIDLPPGRWVAWDELWSERAAALVTDWSTERWLRVIAHSGDAQWWVLGGGWLWWQGGATRRCEFGRRIVVATVAAGALSGLLKWLIRRPRPVGRSRLLHLEIDRHSFPSGHATRAGALMTTLMPLMPRRARVMVAAWGLAVGATRVLLGIHFISDILGGLLIGGIIGRLIAWERPPTRPRLEESVQEAERAARTRRR